MLLLFQWDPSDKVPQQATADPHEREPESDSNKEMPPPDQKEGREDPQLPHQQQPAVLGNCLTRGPAQDTTHGVHECQGRVKSEYTVYD